MEPTYAGCHVVHGKVESFKEHPGASERIVTWLKSH
jgi:hypothetical protein